MSHHSSHTYHDQIIFNPFAHGFEFKLLNPFWWILFLSIGLYRAITRPFPSRCRFHPTCSTYAKDALKEYGFIKALLLIVIRIGKCHPFHPGGVDYLPERNDTKKNISHN